MIVPSHQPVLRSRNSASFAPRVALVDDLDARRARRLLGQRESRSTRDASRSSGSMPRSAERQRLERLLLRRHDALEVREPGIRQRLGDRDHRGQRRPITCIVAAVDCRARPTPSRRAISTEFSAVAFGTSEQLGEHRGDHAARPVGRQVAGDHQVEPGAPDRRGEHLARSARDRRRPDPRRRRAPPMPRPSPDPCGPWPRRSRAPSTSTTTSASACLVGVARAPPRAPARRSRRARSRSRRDRRDPSRGRACDPRTCPGPL